MLKSIATTIILSLISLPCAEADVVTVEATVESVDSDSRTITFSDGNESTRMDVSSNAKLLDNGEKVSLKDMKSGQKIKISYHEDLEIVLSVEVVTEEAEKEVLFDGDNLDDWNYDPKLWKVIDGEMVGECEADLGRGGAFLATRKEFSDFSVTFKYRVAYGNTGFYFRCQKGSDSFQEYEGWQSDVGPGVEGLLGAYFGPSNTRPIASPDSKNTPEIKLEWSENGWNEYTITCRGERISCFVNGVPLMSWSDRQKPKTGHIAIHLHGKQATKIFIKSIVISELK